jgi:hypothetical protein
MTDLLSRDPLYLQYAALPPDDAKPLGGGPATYRVIPRSQMPIDARTLGYTCPTTAIDMQIARREGDESNAGKPPKVVPGQEQT